MAPTAQSMDATWTEAPRTRDERAEEDVVDEFDVEIDLDLADWAEFGTEQMGHA
jgi:hypothetical protein